MTHEEAWAELRPDVDQWERTRQDYDAARARLLATKEDPGAAEAFDRARAENDKRAYLLALKVRNLDRLLRDGQG